MKEPKQMGGLRIVICLRRIAFGDGVGGMERAAADHIAQLVSSGHPVSIFTPTRFMTGTPPDGVDVVDIEWPRWNSGTGVPTFGLAYAVWVGRLRSRLVSELTPGDVLHLHGAAAGVLGSGEKSGLSSVVSVVNPHGMEEFGNFSFVRAPNRLILRKLVRRARYASAVIATDMSLVGAVVANLGISRDRVYCIPNAVDVQRMRGFQSGHRSSEFTIVSVGRLVHNKGYDLLLEALRREDVASLLPTGWKWIHYGSGPEAQRLRSQAADHPVVPLTVDSGQPDAVVQGGIAGCNLFVQPSRYEGSSLTTLEAMAHGVRIVATPVGGIPDKIINGVTGHLSEKVTVDSLAAAITASLRSSEDVGLAAKRLVQAEFSLDACVRKNVELYNFLADAQPGR